MRLPDGSTAEPHPEVLASAAMGCCIGRACTVADGLGSPKSVRRAVVTALTGLQVAMVAPCSIFARCRTSA